MRNDRVLIPVLHMAHDAKCFSPCVYSYFHRRIFIDIYPATLFYHENANVWVV